MYMNVKKLTLTGERLPTSLVNIPSPPKRLFVLGDAGLLEGGQPMVAVVGSRKVSTYGRMVTQKFSEDLAGAGVVIVSGLALGVDSIAHKACLDAGGRTVAVLPTGLDNIYPSSHRQLARKIIEQGGALVTEYDDGTAAYKQNFIERNRLVSGLADGVLITEAARKSGTLHTASFALDQGKTVLAVPGPISSPTSEGTNNLLKSGAVMVTELSDILAALQLDISGAQRQLPLAADEHEQRILDLLSAGHTDSQELIALSRLSTSDFNRTLTMLEITGKIRPLGAGQWGIK